MIDDIGKFIAEKQKLAENWDLEIYPKIEVKNFSDKLIAQLSGKLPVGEGKLGARPFIETNDAAE